MADVTQRIPEDQHQPWKPLRGIKRGSLVRVDGAEVTVRDLTWDPREGHWWADVTGPGDQKASVALAALELIDPEPPTRADVWPAA
jgi:hypothetical protein